MKQLYGWFRWREQQSFWDVWKKNSSFGEQRWGEEPEVSSSSYFPLKYRAFSSPWDLTGSRVCLLPYVVTCCFSSPLADVLHCSPGCVSWPPGQGKDGAGQRCHRRVWGSTAFCFSCWKGPPSPAFNSSQRTSCRCLTSNNSFLCHWLPMYLCLDLSAPGQTESSTLARSATF